MSTKSKSKKAKKPVVAAKRGPGRPSNAERAANKRTDELEKQARQHASYDILRRAAAPAAPTTEQIVEAAVKRMAEEMDRRDTSGAQQACALVDKIATGRMGSATPSPGPITLELDMLRAETACLTIALSQVRDLVAPICGPSPVANNSPANPEPSPVSQIAQDIASVRRQLAALTADAITLRNSIAL